MVGFLAAHQAGRVGRGRARDDADAAVLRDRAQARLRAPATKQKDCHLKTILAMGSYRERLAYVRKLDDWFKYAVINYTGTKFALPESVVARMKKDVGSLPKPASPWAGEPLDMSRGIAAARGVVSAVVTAIPAEVVRRAVTKAAPTTRIVC